MKKVLVLVLALCLLIGCIPAFAEAEEGKVFNIYAWNEEFKGFFEKYYKVPEGVTVNWIITPSDGGAYQQKLDEALLNQENAAADDKVDMFLAEADYILKYAGTPPHSGHRSPGRNRLLQHLSLHRSGCIRR